MKKIMLLIIIICLPLIGSYVCQDDTDDNYMPCALITPAISDCTKNASIISLNTTDQYNYTMADIGDGTCNISFNFTDIGSSYSIVLDDNSSSTINIVQSEDPDINLWFVLFTIFFLCLVFGIIYHEKAFIGNALLFVGGCEALLIGIWVFQSGISIYGVSEYWIYPFAWILVGLGIILTLYSSLDMIYREENF